MKDVKRQAPQAVCDLVLLCQHQSAGQPRGKHQRPLSELSKPRVERRMADQVVRHELPVGSLSISPAGTDCAADVNDTIETLLIVIDPASLAFAATQGSERPAEWIERVCGYDHSLLSLAGILAT
jgi:hypothetical protein